MEWLGLAYVISYTILFAVGFGLAIGYLICLWLLISKFKQQHSGVWKEIGEPNVLLWNSSKNNAVLQDFLRTGRYMELNDAEFSTLCRKTRWLYVASAVIFVVLVFGFFGLALTLAQAAV